MNNIKLCAAGALMAVALSSCHIYKKYELPVNDSQIVGDFKKAVDTPVDLSLIHI